MENERDFINLHPGCRFLEEGEDVDLQIWREALVSCGDHLSRALREYVEMGFECLLEAVDPAKLEGCSHCLRAAGERVFRVYVRRTRQVEGNEAPPHSPAGG